MKLLDKYNKIEKEIYEYFGYKEGWECYPIDDCRDDFWCIDSNEGSVHSWPSIEDYNDDPEHGYYESEIIKRPKEGGVFKGKDYTAIIIDTNCDNNRFFAIFDNKKKVELKEEE